MNRISSAMPLLIKVTPIFAVVALFLWVSPAKATDWYFGGGCIDVPTCVNVMMDQVWGVNVPTDPTPPTVINVLTGTGGGYTSCVSGGTTTGCATGDAQFAIGNVTTSASTFVVSSPSFNLTTGCSGGSCVNANIALLQQDGTYSTSGGHPQYNGCYALSTFASIGSATSGTIATPSSKTGSNCGTDLATSTKVTAIVWDGKDPTGIFNANTAAGNLATTFNTGAIVYLPKGTYVLYTASFGPGTNQMPNNIKFQCQSPSTVTIVNPLFDTGTDDTLTPNHNDVITGCTFAHLNTGGVADYVNNRGQFNESIGMIGADVNNLIYGNVFEYGTADAGDISMTSGTGTGSQPCPLGQAPNAAGNCIAEPTANIVVNNYFHNCDDRGWQVSIGNYNLLANNSLLDCDISFEYNLIGGSAQNFMGNIEMNNNLHCDSKGSGLFQAFAAAGLGTPPNLSGNGCWMDFADDSLGLNMGSSSSFGNHMHSDAASPGAGCLGTESSTKVVKRGNVCASGGVENCANTGC